MNDGTLGIIWLIIFSVSGLITLIYMRKYANDEKMAMIEKGLNPGDMVIKRSKALWPLRFSLLFIGAGLGLFAGYFLDINFRMEEVAYFSMLFIFGGAGLGISYIIEEKRDKENNQQS